MKINDFLHYSNVTPGTAGERTVYGEFDTTAEYVYSDRLKQWDYEAHEKAKKENKSQKHTSEWYEEYLSLYYGKPIKLIHMLIGVNVSSGYQYNVYGFTYNLIRNLF